MNLNSDILGETIRRNFVAKGANGRNLQKFCKAVARGIVISIVGTTFTTMDVGLIPGIGSGVGRGIVIDKIDVDKMIDRSLEYIRTENKKMKNPAVFGDRARPTMDCIMRAIRDHLAQYAQLTSTHAPVFLGSGTVIISSINVDYRKMADNIEKSLRSEGAKGSNLKRTAMAISIGAVTEIVGFHKKDIVSEIVPRGHASVSITGTALSPTPVPGAGEGSGVIT